MSIGTPTLLENEWGKRFHSVAILQVLFAEALHHKTLFCPGLQPKGKRANQDADKTTYPTSLDRRAEHPQQDAAVDGVADDAIGARPYERVIFLHGDTVTPIATEHEPGPDAEGNTHQHGKKSRERDGYSHRE